MKFIIAILFLLVATFINAADGSYQFVSGNTSLGAISGFSTNTTTTNSVINTAAETSLWAFDVPANAMGTNKELWVHIGGYYTNNVGGQSLTITLKFGGTTIYTSTVGASPAAQVVPRPICWDFHLQNTGSASQQWLSGTVAIGGVAASTGFGAGPGVNTVYITYAIGNFAAIDTTTTQTFDVRITHGSNNTIGLVSVGSFAKVIP